MMMPQRPAGGVGSMLSSMLRQRGGQTQGNPFQMPGAPQQPGQMMGGMPQMPQMPQQAMGGPRRPMTL